MMYPPAIRIIIPHPVAMLDPRGKGNRTSRRANRYGKQTFWDGYYGKLSPKQMREAGL